MKKMFAILIVLTMVCSVVCAAAADTQFTKYESEFLSMELPEGEWYKREGEPGITHFFGNALMTVDQGYILINEKEIDLGYDFPDSMSDLFYDKILESLSKTAVDEKIESEDHETDGRKSKIFQYRQLISGREYHIYGFSLIHANVVITVCMFDERKTQEEMISTVQGMVDSVVRK